MPQDGRWGRDDLSSEALWNTDFSLLRRHFTYTAHPVARRQSSVSADGQCCRDERRADEKTRPSSREGVCWACVAPVLTDIVCAYVYIVHTYMLHARVPRQAALERLGQGAGRSGMAVPLVLAARTAHRVSHGPEAHLETSCGLPDRLHSLRRSVRIRDHWRHPRAGAVVSTRDLTLPTCGPRRHGGSLGSCMSSRSIHVRFMSLASRV